MVDMILQFYACFKEFHYQVVNGAPIPEIYNLNKKFKIDKKNQ